MSLKLDLVIREVDGYAQFLVGPADSKSGLVCLTVPSEVVKDDELRAAAVQVARRVFNYWMANEGPPRFDDKTEDKRWEPLREVVDAASILGTVADDPERPC